MENKMREILFRGKRTDNGAWVEGAFCLKDCDDPFGDMVDRPSIIKYDPPCDGFWFRVDPETVGQFTGLTDKNGKKIFEGDILKESDVIYNGEIQINGHIFTVAMRKGCWCVLSTCYFDEWDFLCSNANRCEVIGNIHDNPELLEE